MNIEFEDIIMIYNSELDIDPSIFEDVPQTEFVVRDMELIESVLKISNKSIQRLSKKAGIQSISANSYDTVRQLIQKIIYSILRDVMIIRDEKQVKIISLEDVEMVINKNII